MGQELFEVMLGLPASGFVPALVAMLALGKGLLLWLLLASVLFWPAALVGLFIFVGLGAGRSRRRTQAARTLSGDSW